MTNNNFNLDGPKYVDDKCSVGLQNCDRGLTCIDDGIGNDVGTCCKNGKVSYTS